MLFLFLCNNLQVEAYQNYQHWWFLRRLTKLTKNYKRHFYVHLEPIEKASIFLALLWPRQTSLNPIIPKIWLPAPVKSPDSCKALTRSMASWVFILKWAARSSSRTTLVSWYKQIQQINRKKTKKTFSVPVPVLVTMLSKK